VGSAHPTEGLSTSNKIREKLDPFEGQEALGVVLHSFERPGFVADSHDLILVGPGHDLEIVAKGSGADYEAVISCGVEGVGKPRQSA